MSAGYANTNALHAAVAARTLRNLGVSAVVISPGSRSTPMTHALVEELDCTPALDERSAAFFALGHAKADGKPAVLLCTSGTAAANWLPAVVEARLSGTPLIVLTADRPHEMRECASGQTIDQVKLYGAYPVWSAELAVPAAPEATLAHWRQSFAHAVFRAVESRGPVHLNLPFRDPLPPDEAQPGFVAPDMDLDSYCAFKPPTPVVAGDGSIPDIHFWTKCNAPKETHSRGLIVVGPAPANAPEKFAEGVFTLAKHLGWPVLSDALNPLRGAPGAEAHLVSAYELILRDTENAAALRPALVVRIGPPPTSKTLRARLAEWDAPTLVVSPTGENLDPTHTRAVTLRTSPERWMTEGASRREYSAYAERWADLDAAAGLDLDAALDAKKTFGEPHVARLLGRHLPPGTPLFVGNSMPARDAEMFLPRDSNAYPVFHNRGASGIDGTLSTTLGIAFALGVRTAALIGDLATLHDANALLLAPRLRVPVVIFLINNAGGGIFNHLAVARNPDFEEFWATPQAVDFSKLAAAYAGVTHRLAADIPTLMEEITGASATPGIRLVEIPTDRAADAAFRKALFAKISGR